MIEKMKIKLADWRDREMIQPLRRLVARPIDGGLYEMLNWPMYHTHLATVDGKAIGFSSVILYADGTADDNGTAVLPEYRLNGVASELRFTQARDLRLMGWTTLYCAVQEDNMPGQLWCSRVFGNNCAPIEPAYLPKHYYFYNTIGNIEENLFQRKVREPYPLSPINQERLHNKASRAMQELSKGMAYGDFNMRKAAIRLG